MRILHVSPYYHDAWAYGGIPRIAAALAQKFSDRGHEVTVCTTDACTRDRRLQRADGFSVFTPFTEIDSHGVQVRVFPNLSNGLAYDLQLFLPRGLIRYLSAHSGDFDVAHIHACHNLLTSIAARHLTRAQVPYVLVPNGTAPLIERRQSAKYFFDLLFGRHVIPGAARLVAVSEAERRQLRELGVVDSRITTVPNPIDLSEFQTTIERGAFRRRFGLEDADVVLFLGKLTPRKRLDVLARAFSRLDRPNARLVIAGNDMGYGADLRRLIGELGLTERTLLTGLLTGRERLEALADASVTCYASQHEIFGLVPIEALLVGTPVIVADDSGCGEVISRTGGGLIVRQGDVGDLAQAIAEVMDSRHKWRELALGASRQVRALFEADAVCDQLETVYRDAIDSNRTRSANEPRIS